MSFQITQICICCNFCLPVCPTGAISEQEIFEIDPQKCNHCEGFADAPLCVPRCPVKCIIPLDRAEIRGS